MPEELDTQKEINITPVEQQLSALRAKLAGHKVFGKCRSQLGRMPLYNFLNEDTPTRALTVFNDWCADQRVMIHMLTQFKRDGHMYAYQELLDALTSNHVITGEELPLEQTESGVLVLFNLEKTLLLTRWLYTSEFKDAIHWIKNEELDPKRNQCGSLTPKFMEMFPELRDEFLRQEHQYHVVSPTNTFCDKYVRSSWDKIDKEFGHDEHFPIFIDPRRTHNWELVSCVGVFVAGVTQKDVLRLFSREEQKDITTWSFEYPKFERGNFYASFSSFSRMWIGFHKEEEHKEWSARYPSYVSKGASHNLGAILLTEEMQRNTQGLFTPRNPLPSYEALERIYPNSQEVDIENSRILLAFPCSG